MARTITLCRLVAARMRSSAAARSGSGTSHGIVLSRVVEANTQARSSAASTVLAGIDWSYSTNWPLCFRLMAG